MRNVNPTLIGSSQSAAHARSFFPGGVRRLHENATRQLVSGIAVWILVVVAMKIV